VMKLQPWSETTLQPTGLQVFPEAHIAGGRGEDTKDIGVGFMPVYLDIEKARQDYPDTQISTATVARAALGG